MESWARIFELLMSPGIDSKESIPQAYVSWRAGYDNPIPARFLAPMDCLKIPAQNIFPYSIERMTESAQYVVCDRFLLPF